MKLEPTYHLLDRLNRAPRDVAKRRNPQQRDESSEEPDVGAQPHVALVG